MQQRDDWRLTGALEHQQGRGDPFAAAVRATRMPMVITNPQLPDNPIVYCNEAFQNLSGYGRDEIVGRNCRFLQGEGTDRDAVARIRAAVDSGTDVEANLLNYRKDGVPFWNALYMSPVRDDSGVIRYYFASQLDISDRVMAEQAAVQRRQAVEAEILERTAELERVLAAKTVLLHELDHRVKNNLAMVGSLLRLQTRTTTDPSLATSLNGTLRRIDALSSVHRRLFQNANITRFDVGGFLNDLATERLAAAGLDRIALTTDLQAVEVGPGNASAIGLVLDEILVNTIDHAFAGVRSGTLALRTRADGGLARVDVTDDGPGTVPGIADEFGRSLFDRLSRQIGLQATWTGLEPGTRVSLQFPLDGAA